MLLAVTAVSADELLMRDGSRMLGTVVKKDSDALEFDTAFAGTIKVKWAEIEEVRTDEPMKVMLSNDEIVMTTAIRNTADVVTLETGSEDEPAPVERKTGGSARAINSQAAPTSPSRAIVAIPIRMNLSSMPT
jgi:hypothetical protein